MGSTFTTMHGKTIKGFAGKEYPVPMYLQFVPGVVVEVVHSEQSQRYGGPRTINTIIAKPHITEKISKRKANLGEKERYFPLLRTFNDVPSKGDPVLLCTIGNTNYYLGPINTNNNSPTWNDDPSYIAELQFEEGRKTLRTGVKYGKSGETLNFNKEISYPRMTKKRKEELDYGNAFFETTGDTIFEGRHGNSLRIGSRSNNPYIFISNKRNAGNHVESIVDGSLITITSNGTITQHVGNFSDETTIFKLSSDHTDNTYPIGDVYSYLMGGQNQENIYNYDKNQILIQSHRITLNTKQDDIFISSKKDIHIGAGEEMTISSNNNVFFECTNFNIGHPDRAFEMEPMVLGNTLKEVLNDIVALFSKIQVLTQLGPQNILPTTQVDIQSITNKIDTIVSEFHQIEGN